jgi:DNA polymerase
LAAIAPRLVVCLGAVAAQALLGNEFRITHQRGQLLAETSIAPLVMATVHPSFVLRVPDAQARRAAFDALVADLRVAAAARQPHHT